MPTHDKLEQNPLQGDEHFAICTQRQVDRGVPESIANEVCTVLSTVLGNNALKEASDMVIVPAIFTAEGVHNGLFKPWKSIANAAPTLLGVPLFINQIDEHVNGKVPPVDDPKRHHGLVLQVNKDQKNRRLTGLIGLFKPEYLKAKGLSPARVKFQESLVNSVKKGGRFAISVSYLARLLRTPGVIANRPYAYVEDGHRFNGVSIVPEGAEPTALMNGLDKESSFDVLENGFNAEFDESFSNLIEPLNTSHEQSPTTAMDADQLRSMSITRLGEMNPEVAKLVNAHDRSQQELVAANKQVNDLNLKVKAVEKDAEIVSTILANILDEEKAEQLLANAEDGASLAKQVQEHVTALANKVAEASKKDEEKLKERISTAKKSLANRMKAEDLKDFEDPKDLEGTAKRLEKLANTVGAKRIAPPKAPLANVSEDFEEVDDSEDDEESLANEHSSEYGALLEMRGEVPAPKGKTAKTQEADA